MELKVWVEGIQRIVCGVTVNTTCQDVVFALAHATGKVGRFTLIERWRNNERLLAPNENPLKLLLKWGEYANDVQFILQRSENKQQQTQQQQQQRHVAEASNNNNNILNSDNNNKNATQMHAVLAKKPLGLSNIENACNAQQQQQKSQHQQLANEVNINGVIQQDKVNELKKGFGAHDVKQIENIGIVKGIPQQRTIAQQQQQQKHAPTTTHSPLPHLQPKHEKSHSNPIEMTASNNAHATAVVGAYNEFHNNNNNNIYQQLGAHNSKSINEINLAVVRNSLDRRLTNANVNASPDILFNTQHANNNNNNNNISNSSSNSNSSNSNENLLDIYNGNAVKQFNNSASPEHYKNAPTISANGALVPPPYRDPPPPRNSPMQLTQQQQQQHLRMPSNNASPVATQNTNPFLNDYNSNSSNNSNSNNNDYDYEFTNISNNNASSTNEESESIFQATQWNDLLQLIKFQREKITAQQMELSKYDAEIVFLENKERDHAQELEAISREITKADQIFRQGSEQLQTLQYVEEENELVKQQEKTLKSEIALLRSKLANCETELLQCKNKIRLLMDDIDAEQRAITNKQKSNRQNVERDFLIEMERIQSEIDQAMHNSDTSNKTAENLKKEIVLIEKAIAEKKRQVEQLVNEMKEVNLQSLTVTTSEEIKHLLEGSNKPGSSRRIIGSPRQLENAVPTSKNPHGVWV